MAKIWENRSVSLYLSELSVIEKRLSKRGNTLELFVHPEFGKVLVINKEIQHVEAWTPLYHEPLVHLPIAFIKSVNRVLILGGGSLFTAFEVLKYDSVLEVVLVDFDPEVIGLTRKHYKYSRKVLTDKRLKLLNEEAFTFVKNDTNKYDLILNDSIDLLNHSKNYVSGNVFKLLANHLTPDGICCDSIYRHIFEKTTTIKTIRMLRNLYNNAFSLITIPEYPGILHLLCLWGFNPGLSQSSTALVNKIQRKWINEPQMNPCSLYSPRFLSFYLFLPPYIKKRLSIL